MYVHITYKNNMNIPNLWQRMIVFSTTVCASWFPLSGDGLTPQTCTAALRTSRCQLFWPPVPTSQLSPSPSQSGMCFFANPKKTGYQVCFRTDFQSTRHAWHFPDWSFSYSNPQKDVEKSISHSKHRDQNHKFLYFFRSPKDAISSHLFSPWFLRGVLNITHDGSMVLLYMVTWIPSIYPIYVIYTSTMDPMG